MRVKTFILVLVIAVLLIIMAFLWPIRSHAQTSMYDGVWTITYVDCQGNEFVYKGSKIDDFEGNWLMFTDGSRKEHAILMYSTCSTVRMEREGQ